MIDLTNKVTIVTGGSRGIGSACVKLFAQAGSKVAFTYKSKKQESEELENLFPGFVKSYQVDMESEKEIVEMVEAAEKEFGKVDILVHNAGIWNDGTLETTTLAHWQQLMRVNLDSTFLFARACAPIMKKNKFGRMIFISSTAGQRGESFHSHYAASKGGVISFTKSLAVELAPYNITTNSVAPGWVDTDMNNEVFADAEFKEIARKGIPVGRIPTPEDIAGPALFLASDLARHINGEILNVNGGSVLCG
ncbi:MAG: oxidoreductase [Ignavibacteria bacterium]|nr:MAG: oxidoreductase [Ignavibacteria bacterium]KAF0160571.1 MAG: oxidoreductase [Ignavibacteria bacterium]